ncbi:MAG TPA: GGDEF domain-containing protein [Solirubrobacterales bacterium]|nr:GGDEF domain-containing protein [Solirubrobacterales bacterium]
MHEELGSAGSRPQDRDELAKAWLVRLIENTAAAEVGELPLAWVAREASPLIAEILAILERPAGAAERALERSGPSRLARLARLRRGPDAPERIPRDLAALQGLLIDCLLSETRERGPDELSTAVGRLTEVFGAIQGEVTRSLVEERTGGAAPDPLTGLAGAPQFAESARILIAEQRRYGHPFSIALIDIDGLDRVNEAYGRRAGDRMLAAVARVVARQVREIDQAFRTGDDELCVVAPHQEALGVALLGKRLVELLASAQLADGPRVAISVGVASCPRHGDSPERLLDAAEQASYAARAAGSGVEVAG